MTVTWVFSAINGAQGAHHCISAKWRLARGHLSGIDAQNSMFYIILPFPYVDFVLNVLDILVLCWLNLVQPNNVKIE